MGTITIFQSRWMTSIFFGRRGWLSFRGSKKNHYGSTTPLLTEISPSPSSQEILSSTTVGIRHSPPLLHLDSFQFFLKYLWRTAMFFFFALFNYSGMLHAIAGDYQFAVASAMTWNLIGLGTFVDITCAVFMGLNTRPQWLRESYFLCACVLIPAWVESQYGLPEITTSFIVTWCIGRIPWWVFFILPVLQSLPPLPMFIVWYAYNSLSLNICSWLGTLITILFITQLKIHVGHGVFIMLLSRILQYNHPPGPIFTLTIIIASSSVYLSQVWSP